jgi:hypothetical protein
VFGKNRFVLRAIFEVLNQQVGWDFGEIEVFRVWWLRKILLETEESLRRAVFGIWFGYSFY